MGVASWFRRRRAAAISTIAVSAAAITVASMAVAYEGTPSAEVDLNDGGAWVTRASSLSIGHVNKSAALIDGDVIADADDYDVLQSGADVVVTAGGSATPLDPVKLTLGKQVSVPDTAVLALGARTLAVHDQKSGELWVLPVDELTGFSESAEPVAELGRGARVTVGRDGTVHTVDPASGEVSSIATDEGRPGSATRATLSGIDPDDALTISAVGADPVVLDATTRELFTRAGLIAQIPGDGPLVLQVPSDAASTVALATDDALLSAMLEPGSKPSAPARTPTDAAGGPVAPVQMDGCTYAAWSGSNRFIRDCVGIDADLISDIVDASEDADLTFRVNRRTVVLNEVVTGVSWLVDGDLTKVDNWSDMTPPDGESDDTEKSSELTLDVAPPERSDKNTDPIANDDDLGVRAGRSTILPVTSNDSDIDGDVLTISLPNGQPSWGRVTPVLNGQALQIEVDAEQTGTTVFTYQVSDGRGGRAKATARVTVHPEGQNAQPKMQRNIAVPVEVGAQATYNVIPDWYDPDGDDVFLQAAATADGNEVRFTPDGRVTLTASSGATGISEVTVVVSDGRSTSSGLLKFDVRAAGTTKPVTTPDHVIVRADEKATVSPLANDVSGSAMPLRLGAVGTVPDATVTPHLDQGTFDFVSEKVGTTYVVYSAASGNGSATGVVRIDVIEPTKEVAPPVAVRDVAMIPTRGDVLVDVLVNDVDPVGGVLVVQSVTASPASGLSVAVVNNENVRITDPIGLAQPERISYTVSNGTQTSTGDIIVLPVPPPSDPLPPVTAPDLLAVRAQDVGTVDVLENDQSPVGSRLTLSPELVAGLDPALGEAFVSGGVLRVRAAGKSGKGDVTYQVVDENGQKATAVVTVTVIGIDEASNLAPQPRNVTARVIAGRETVVAVPLDGIDTDGDSVELVGIATAPSRGAVISVGDNTFIYRADSGQAGTDLFTYRVRDRLGAESEATARIGISKPAAINQPPTAVVDSIRVRPGREVEVAVTANDTDPDGDPVSLVEDSVVVPDIEGATARTDGNVVVLKVPDEEMRFAVQYTIEDARGSRAVGAIQVTVDENVPAVPPIARDDRVRLDQIGEDGTVDVEILANDVDPDGMRDDLDISVIDEGGELLPDRKVRVSVGTTRQLIEYRLTDPDGGVARAFIFVPGRSELRPVVITGGGSITVASGQTVRIPLADHVRVSEGGSPRLASTSRPTALHSDGRSMVADATTLTYTSAPGYVGTDTITFEAVGGRDGEESRALLSIGVTVTGTSTTPLVFSGSTLQLGRGEAAQTLSLRALVDDPDPAVVSATQFRLVGATPPGITAELTGSTLSVAARDDAAEGPVGALTVEANDGRRPAVRAQIQLTVTSTVVPLTTTTDDYATTRPGSPVTVQVTANDVNPYPQTPLRVISADVVSGDASATFTDGSVTVTPGDFIGTVRVEYRVQDASGDAARVVTGAVIVTVQGPPGAPGTPLIGAVASGQVALSWAAPSTTGGAAITSYVIRTVSGQQVGTCGTTACTVTGLTDGQDYQFTVSAINANGEGPQSAPSAVASPRRAPDPPAQVSAATAPNSAMVTWTGVAGATSYTVYAEPLPPDQRPSITVNGGTSVNWGGLTNGVSYRFRVVAHADGLESSSSPWSRGVIPSQLPDGMGAPTVNRVDDVTFDLSWSPPNDGGAAITRYNVQVHGSGGSRTVTATGTGTRIVIGASEAPVSFSIAAENRNGSAPQSARTQQYSTVRAPSAPGQPSLSGNGGTLQVSFSDPDLGGADASTARYELMINGGEQIIPVNASRTFAWPDGDPITVQVRVITSAYGKDYTSGWSSPSNPYTPASAPGAPVASATGAAGGISVTWSTGDSAGGTMDRMQQRIDGGTWRDIGLAGSRTDTYPAGERHVYEFRNSNTMGTWSGITTVEGTAQ